MTFLDQILNAVESFVNAILGAVVTLLQALGINVDIDPIDIDSGQ